MQSTELATRDRAQSRWLQRCAGDGNGFDRSSTAVAELELPPAVFKTCPWQPRELIETGLRQWQCCCAAALRDDQVIGMPSRAVDEAWHGLILCTARYQTFCATAYGKFMHHHPVGGAPADIPAATDPMDEQPRRTSIAWSLVAMPGEQVFYGISTTVSVWTSGGASIWIGLRRSRPPSPNFVRASGIDD